MDRFHFFLCTFAATFGRGALNRMKPVGVFMAQIYFTASPAARTEL